MRSQASVVVAGHVCLDVIPQLAGPVALAPGHLVTAGPAALSTGGAVANVGFALHRLGVPVGLMGKVGDDLFGHAVLEAVRARGPELAEGMLVAAGEATSYSVVISPPGVDRSFLHCPGANASFAAADVRYDEVARARILHFGYPPMMARMYAEGGRELREILTRAGALGTVTSLDLCHPDASGTDWAALLERVLGAVDVFAPSVDELQVMLDGSETPADRELVTRLAERALTMGAGVVALKLGDQGLYLRTAADPARLAPMCAALGLDAGAWRDREVLSPCFAARAVAGTTGSGDCTIAGLLAGMLRGEDPVTAATSATAVGACSVEAPDATSGVGPWSEIAGRLAAGWPRLPIAPALAGGAAWRRDARGTLFDPEETP